MSAAFAQQDKPQQPVPTGQPTPSVAVQPASPATPAAPPEPVPTPEMGAKGIGLCEYFLPHSNWVKAGPWGAWGEGTVFTSPGTIGQSPYFETLRRDLIAVTDETLRGFSVVQAVPVEKLIQGPSPKPLTMPELAKLNGLFACVSAKTALVVTFGWNKKLNMQITWTVFSSSGREWEIKTESTSKDTYGKFPDVADPNLKPVWIGLARENTKQFLDRLADVMKDDKNMR